MNRHSLLEGDPPGQIVRIAPPEPRDIQGRTLEQARYQDRCHREEEAARRWNRAYRPLLLLDRICDIAARIVVCSLPFSTLLLWILTTFETHHWIGLCAFLGSLAYLVLYAACIGPALRDALRRIQADAQASGVDLDTVGPPPGQLKS